MRNFIRMAIVSLGLVTALVGCQGKDGNNYHTSEFQSCVDLGGGCVPQVQYEFNTQFLTIYPPDEQGRPQGATQNNGGIVYYSNLDGCTQRNNQTISVNSGEHLARYIPVELPRNGGLACIDTMVLNTNRDYPYQNWGIDPNSLLFSEFKMYGYVSMWYGGGQTTPVVGGNIISKLINVIPSQSSGTGSNITNPYNQESFQDRKSRAEKVSVPLVCNLDHGDNTINDDCRGRTCKRIQNPVFHTGNLGICEY